VPKTPSYRQRAGYTQALVTLTDSATGKRRDYWLGEAQSPQSREAYHRLIAEWEANGRRLPDPPAKPGALGTAAISPLTVSDLMRQYWRWARDYYSGAGANGVKMSLRVLRECHGSTDAAAFGPNALRVVREAMIRGRAEGERPRQPWCRKTVNTRVGHIVRMFRWAASRELLSPLAFQALQTLPALKRGRCGAPDHAPVGPVPRADVEAVRPFVSRPVWALIELQLLTGARPGELLQLRARDLDTTPADGVWVYRPTQHKNAHRLIQRSIYLGPRAQQVLAPFMADRPIDAYLFSPAEAESERRAVLHSRRKTPMSCGNTPGSNRQDAPQRAAGDCYTTASYRRAIERSCDLAFPPPEHLRPRALGTRRESEPELLARLGPENRAALAEWRRTHRWHPNQLRHSAGTLIRRECGLEAAQLVLGHASAVVTDAVYAERDAAKVASVIRQIG
jgi:integrase